MSDLHSLLNIFHNAILDQDTSQAVPAVKVNPRISPENQMLIYIEGYRLRLTEAIRSDYPALLLYLGDHAFDELALRYIESTPPTNYNLDRYPHAFATTVHEYANDDFASDLATLESSIARVFMLDESEALMPDALIDITPERLAEMVMNPRTASCLLHLRYPADIYMADMRENGAPAKPEMETRYLYLVRHDNEVKRHVVSTPEYLILTQLCEGKTVDAALEFVAERYPELIPEFVGVLQTNLAQWITNGFFQSSLG